DGRAGTDARGDRDPVLGGDAADDGGAGEDDLEGAVGGDRKALREWPEVTADPPDPVSVRVDTALVQASDPELGDAPAVDGEADLLVLSSPPLVPPGNAGRWRVRRPAYGQRPGEGADLPVCDDGGAEAHAARRPPTVQSDARRPGAFDEAGG